MLRSVFLYLLVVLSTRRSVAKVLLVLNTIKKNHHISSCLELDSKILFSKDILKKKENLGDNIVDDTVIRLVLQNTLDSGQSLSLTKNSEILALTISKNRETYVFVTEVYRRVDENLWKTSCINRWRHLVSTTSLQILEVKTSHSFSI